MSIATKALAIDAFVAAALPPVCDITEAKAEGFVDFKLAFFEGELIAEFRRADSVPYAFSEFGLERRLTTLTREKKPHAFTEYVLALVRAKKAEGVAR